MTAYRILSKFFILISLLGFSCSPKIFPGDDGALTTEDITQNRDMAQYDQGGHFSCCRATDETGIKIEEKTVRDFIWQHWVEKKKGYIKISYMGADNSSTTHYFIEPNENNEWIIKWKMLSEHSLPEYNQPIREGFGTVERISSLKRKGDWELYFKPVSGNSINSIPIF